MKIDINPYEARNLYFALEGLPKLVQSFEKTLSKKEKKLLDKFNTEFEGHARLEVLDAGEKITAISLKKKGFLVGNTPRTDWYHLSALFLQDFESVKEELEKTIK